MSLKKIRSYSIKISLISTGHTHTRYRSLSSSCSNSSMSLLYGFKFRSAFLLATVFLMAVLIAKTFHQSGFHLDIYSSVKSLADRYKIHATPKPNEVENAKKASKPNKYRFRNGIITFTNTSYHLSPENLANTSRAELENLYENVVLEITADCTTARRFGRRDDGGWDLCYVGPFHPMQPCFSFSYGVKNVWEFDDEIAAGFGCQVLTFDPSMKQASHMRNEKIAFLKEGLGAGKAVVNGWKLDSYLGFLKRFGAENFVIDILKMDIEGAEWAALGTAVRDGSLKNVKQLMLEYHIQLDSMEKHFPIFKALYDLGFREWHHNWNFQGNYDSTLNRNKDGARTCCHEIYYININFLTTNRPFRNPAGTKIVNPLAGAK